MNNKIIAIIPARSGSKGLKNKNIKELDGKPLIAYTIEAALRSNVFEDVFVSTDSKEYKKIAEKYGAWVPFFRDNELAKDTTSTNEVVKDVIVKLRNSGKEYDDLMILQPTSPLRDEEDIKNSIRLFNEKKANSVVSMCECDYSPLLTKELDEEMNLDGFLSKLNKIRRQDLKKSYRLNGAIYLMKVDYFLKYEDFYKKNSYAFIMKKEKSIDIDDLYDFKLVEFLIKNKFMENK